MTPEEKEQDVIFMLERRCEVLKLKLNRKTIAVERLKKSIADNVFNKESKLLEQKIAIDNLSAELGRMVRKMKRLSNK